MHLQPQNDAFGASMGSMKKADAFFMLVLFYWGECWGVVGPPKRNFREKGMEVNAGNGAPFFFNI